MKLRSVMEHSFAQIPRANIPRSTFDRSHGYKTTFDAGYLVPVYHDEALPGDTFSANLNVVMRLTTPLRPFMDNVVVDFFFFAVPLRLIWTNWAKFNGEQVAGSLDPVGSTDFICPIMTSPGGGYGEMSLYDYFGLPTKVAGIDHVAFFTRGYNKIWNDWFRDQNLQDYVTVDVDDGPDDPADYVLLRRGKRPDYFTSALPWPQKGDSVSIPLGTIAPVVNDGTEWTWAENAAGTAGPTQFNRTTNVAGSAVTMEDAGVTGGASMYYKSGLQADLSTATAATINQLRQSFQVQKLYERDSRGGTRYPEILLSHFGVYDPQHAILQRPEYLGGGSVRLNVHQNLSTNGATGAASLGLAAGSFGPMVAYGTATGSGIGFTKSFTEHCIIIGLASARADMTYQQGMLKHWSRSTRWDFYWPSLAQIGEQTILNKEIYCDGTANDDLVFGYQERYAEYRYKPSQVTGQFRSNTTTPLDMWHLALEFGALPALNSSFIQEDPPIDRVICVPGEPHFIYDSYMKLICARPMPVFGVPGMIDHF